MRETWMPLPVGLVHQTQFYILQFVHQVLLVYLYKIYAFEEYDKSVNNELNYISSNT